MLFNSVVFALFFGIVYVVYWRLPKRHQNLFLLAGSLFFYGCWNWRLLPLIVFSASVDYVAGWRTFRASDDRRRRAWLTASIATNLGLLFFFKYYNFFAESLADLLEMFGFHSPLRTLRIILPVGISFYTFQSMAYTIDIYRRQLEPCRKYTDFLLYVSFFPQLVAGPIERGRRLLPQIVKPREPLSLARRISGLKLIAIGYFQKVAIADTLAIVTDAAYGSADQANIMVSTVGVMSFVFQAYGDFSGYSKIARGTARLLGIELMLNFNQPFFSYSIQEFWRRWHISLSTWLRDYVYIPLGGSRRSPVRVYTNLMLTMLVAGIWHGASYNFVVFGFLHGLYLSTWRELERRGFGPPKRKTTFVASVLLTFFLFSFSLLFFRGDDFEQSLAMLRGFTVWEGQFGLEAWLLLFYASLSFTLDGFMERAIRQGRSHMLTLFSRNWVVETLVFTGLIVFTALVGENNVEPFVYFQF